MARSPISSPTEGELQILSDQERTAKPYIRWGKGRRERMGSRDETGDIYVCPRPITSSELLSRLFISSFALQASLRPFALARKGSALIAYQQYCISSKKSHKPKRHEYQVSVA